MKKLLYTNNPQVKQEYKQAHSEQVAPIIMIIIALFACGLVVLLVGVL